MSKYRIPEYGVGSVFGFEEAEAAMRAMQQETFTNGPLRAAFESEFAEYVGARYALGMTSCTAGLESAAELLRLGPDDEVITTPQTFIATVLPLLRRRVNVVFADVKADTLNIDPASIESKVSPRTKAIFVVHYGGLPCDMDPIMEIAAEHGVRVVQDAAHAPGAAYKGRMIGSFGDLTSFSFHSLKNMTTLGEGGMLVTNDEDLYAAGRKLRSIWVVGESRPRENTRIGPYEKPAYPYPSHDRSAYDIEYEAFPAVGNNYRMNEAQAAVGSAQLKKLTGFNDARRRAAHFLNQELSAIDGISVQAEPADRKHVYHLYTMFVEPDGTGERRDRLIEFLDKDRGIQIVQRYFPLHLLPEFRYLGHSFGECPVTERVFFESQLNLPMHPTLTQDQLEYMAESVREGWEAVKG